MAIKYIKRFGARIAARCKRLLFRPYILRRDFAGEQLQFYIGDQFGEGAYSPVHHSSWPELEWVKANCIKPGDIVVDCGANHGFSTVLFSKWAGATGKVHAFEPFDHNMQILQRNLALNDVRNVICHATAVGASRGTVEISLHSNATIVSNSFKPVHRKSVPLVTLDEVLADSRVDFVKIDVEGYEFEVLKGAQKVMERAPRLDIELHVNHYADREANLATILGLLPLQRYSHIYIQLEIDGAIVPFDTTRHSMAILAQCEVVHLFCY